MILKWQIASFRTVTEQGSHSCASTHPGTPFGWFEHFSYTSKLTNGFNQNVMDPLEFYEKWNASILFRVAHTNKIVIVNTFFYFFIWDPLNLVLRTHCYWKTKHLCIWYAIDLYSAKTTNSCHFHTANITIFCSYQACQEIDITWHFRATNLALQLAS